MIIDPSTAKEHFYNLLKDVNTNHKEVQIISDNKEYNAVLISLEYWRSVQETLMLEQTGVLDETRKREKDHSGFTDIDDIDWDSL